uniref:CD36 family protein n=1 Tax=Heterorhabditis bacteriophora TaxID=37862 RepID=A0A1I7WMB8_HETBA
MSLSPKLFIVFTLLSGAVLILIGVLALTLAPNMIDRKMDYLGYDRDTAELNAMTKKWLHPPYDMRMYFWLFTIINEKEILKGVKPEVKEIGPFTFIEYQQKVFHQFDRNDTRVGIVCCYFYLACCKLVDFALLGSLHKMAIEAVLTAQKRESPFITVTVGEALFDGYHDPLLDLVCNNHSLISALCQLAKIPARIGFFYGQNNTDDGLYEVHTGLGAPWNIGKLCTVEVITWNNLTMLPETTWQSKYARMINAGCLPAGLLDIGHCQPGEPRVYLSQAHFLNSPYDVWSSVSGLAKPTFENDDTFVDLEATSGVPVNAKRVMQLNIGMVKGNLNILVNTTNVIIPVLWMNETASFDEGTRDQLLNELLFSKSVDYITCLWNLECHIMFCFFRHFAFILGITLLSIGILVWFGLVAVIAIYSVKRCQVEMPHSEDQQAIMQNEYEDTEGEAIGN